MSGLLFSPLRIGPLTVRNRIVFSAHLTNYAHDGLPTEQHAEYYAARAAGGAGLIISEEHTTHPADRPYEKLIRGFDPAAVDGYRRITEAVRAHGTPILAQLNHNGGQSSSMYSRLPLWAPSPVPDPMFREVPKAVDEREIAEVVAGYALVAGHCAEGGFDGVELQCSQSSIVRGFLSRATNQRTDGYGGSVRNRARLLLEIIDAVRDAIGPVRALGVRLCGDELIEGGITLDEGVEVAKLVEATGKVDYVNTSIGVATSTLYMIEASMAVPRGYALFISSAIREAVRLPVVGVGRIKDPAQAERALAEGHCDLVGVVRGQIADPDFAAKARAGQAADIRTCLSCNQECIGRVGHNRWLGCVENPGAGQESGVAAGPDGGAAARWGSGVAEGRDGGAAARWNSPVAAGPDSDAATGLANGAAAGRDGGAANGAGVGRESGVASGQESGAGAGRDSSVAPGWKNGAKRGTASLPTPGPRPKRVLVVGGGPAGLQAASSAARRGHHVTLFERDGATGGQVALAARAPGRAEFHDLVRNLLAECERYGVDVKTAAGATAELLRAESPDVVVLATGAKPRTPHWGRGLERVVDVRDVLEDRAKPEGEVSVLDDLGFHQATSVAELLADRGCVVRLSTPGMVVGQDLGLTLDMETFSVRAHAKGIRQHTDEVVLEASEVDGRIVLRVSTHTTGVMREIACDWVVCATHQEPEDELWRQLKDAPFAVYRAGDCVTPRRAHAAVVEGHRIGVAL